MGQSERNAWIEAAKQLLLESEKDADSAVVQMFMLYDEAAYKVEQSIHALYSRYAGENGLTLAQARRYISGEEFSVWRNSLQGYIQAGQADSKILLELNTLAMKDRISRQEQLLSEIYRHMADYAGMGSSTLDGLLSDIVRSNYYKSAYQLQRGMGVGFKVPRINEALVKQLVSYPWSTKHFSTSIWGKADVIAAHLKRELTLGFIEGSSVQKMAREIRQVFDVGRYEAERLVRTEAKYFANQGQLEGYKADGIEKYKFVGGSEGSHSCECGEMNGKVFAVDEAEAGINFPPLHPNCLCIVVAHFERSMFRDRQAEPMSSRTSLEEWKARYTQKD